MDFNKDYVKPGWKTTEFWAMLASAILGFLMFSGVITKKDSTDILLYTNSIMGSGVTLASVVAYIISRGKAKTPKKYKEIDYEKLINDIRDIVQENKKDT